MIHNSLFQYFLKGKYNLLQFDTAMADYHEIGELT